MNPYQSKAAIPILVRGVGGMGRYVADPYQVPQFSLNGLGAEEAPTPAPKKDIDPKFWWALGGVVGAVVYFGRTQQAK